jgi:hypothetical protein
MMRVSSCVSLSVLQVQYIGAIGGKDVAETTAHPAKPAWTNAVARRRNFAGRGSKTGICELKILDVRIGMNILLSIVCNENELML